jgi:hypothetical protein
MFFQDFLVGLPGSRKILTLYTSLAKVFRKFALTIIVADLVLSGYDTTKTNGTHLDKSATSY